MFFFRCSDQNICWGTVDECTAHRMDLVFESCRLCLHLASIVQSFLYLLPLLLRHILLDQRLHARPPRHQRTQSLELIRYPPPQWSKTPCPRKPHQCCCRDVSVPQVGGLAFLALRIASSTPAPLPPYQWPHNGLLNPKRSSSCRSFGEWKNFKGEK